MEITNTNNRGNISGEGKNIPARMVFESMAENYQAAVLYVVNQCSEYRQELEDKGRRVEDVEKAWRFYKSDDNGYNCVLTYIYRETDD